MAWFTKADRERLDIVVHWSESSRDEVRVCASRLDAHLLRIEALEVSVAGVQGDVDRLAATKADKRTRKTPAKKVAAKPAKKAATRKAVRGH